MLNRLIVIFAILAATIGYSVYTRKNLETNLASNQVQAVLNKLPTTVFQTLQGDEYPVDMAYPADLVLVHFWGTWCAPCEAELPELLTLINHYKGQTGIKFLLVAVNDEVLKIQKQLKTLSVPNGTSITWLLDNRNAHRDLFGTTRVPETYVFSSDKTTLRKFVGPQEWNKTVFFQTFDELLQISTHKL